MANYRKFSNEEDDDFDDFDGFDNFDEEIKQEPGADVYVPESAQGNLQEEEKADEIEIIDPYAPVVSPKTDSNIDSNTGELPKRRLRKWLIPAIISAVIVITFAGAFLVVRNSPSKAKVDLYKYYNITEDSSGFAVVVDRKICEEQGIIEDSEYYVPNTIVEKYITDKFYYDEKNNLILVALENYVREIPVGERCYMDGETRTETDYTMVKYLNNQIYINAKLLKEFTGCQYNYFEKPARIAFETADIFSKEAIRLNPSAKAKIRIEDSIKSDIIGDGEENVKWYATERKEDWIKTESEDGRIGYIKSKDISSEEKADFPKLEKREYKNQLKDYNISLVWDGIYVVEENAGIEKRLENVTNVNTISPTWYRVKTTDGEIESLADRDYVDYVHSLGYEIWPLISDFEAGTEGGFDEKELLSNTTSRRRIISTLMSEVKEYGYDGINVDFEKIKDAWGRDFVQFIRELSIECRKAEIVLSVDNYVPFSFNEFYGRAAQSECVDYVIVMCYDEHYDGGPAAGSTASISYLHKGISETKKTVDSRKIIAGVPFYSRLWQIDTATDYSFGVVETTGSVLSTKAYSMTGGTAIADELGLIREWSEELKQTVASGQNGPYFYQIWLETVQSMEHRVDYIVEEKIGGIAAWDLGSEDSEVWKVFAKIYN